MADQIRKSDTPEETPKGKSPQQWNHYWTSEMDAAGKRFRKHLKRGNAIVQRFNDERAGRGAAEHADLPYNGTADKKLNLFHTNVSTMLSMLYGQTPKIDVAREHQDPDDDQARVAAVIIQRILEADVRDTGEDLSTVYRAVLQDRLLPGNGIARVRYDMATTTVPTLNPEAGTVEDVEQVVWEDAPIDYVHWQDVRWGWCRNWKEMPWLSFRSYLTKDKATERFGEKIANNLEYKEHQPGGSEKKDETYETDQKDSIKKAEIWEIWHKEDRKVFWWQAGAASILDMKDDPLGLDGFWPAPKPLIANQTTTLMMPTPDYVLAQDLYNQIDELYSRITTITRAIKVVGVYDQGAGDSVGRMLKEGVENDLIPVSNWAMFAEKGGLDGSIDWFPVQEVVGTLATLRQVLGETIELLYQVTGMSDILRGANTDQYTSDGTNQLKAKFGSIRVQALQDEFARFCSDLEALKAEVIAKHFEPQTIVKQSGAQFLPKVDHHLIEPALQLIKSPDVKWRINIKPESLSMVDYAQLKSERVEYLTSMATFLQSGQAMVQAVPQSMPILLEFMKFGMAGFKGADYMEGLLDQAIQMAQQQPPQGQNDQKAQADAQKAQIELQKEQIKLQGIQAKVQGDMQKLQLKAQTDMANIQAKLQAALQERQQDAQFDQELEDRQSQYSLLEIQQELEAALTEISANLESTLTIEQAQMQHDMTVNTQEHQHRLSEIRSTPTGGSNE